MAKKRRGHGEGSLFKRSDGRWVARITVGFDADGKQKTRTRYGRTKIEAQEKLREMTNAKADGTITPPNQQTVCQYLRDWLETAAPEKLEPSTIERFDGLLRNHLAPFLQRVKLSALQPDRVRQLYADLKTNGRSDATRRNAHAFLRRVLNVAKREGVIRENPCSLVDAPKYQLPDIKPLTTEQMQNLLQVAEGHRLEAMFVLALTGGFRLSEMLALKWENIDLERGTVTIRHSLQVVRGKYRLKSPKSKAGIRTVAVGQMGTDALHRHRATLLREGLAGCDIVFPTAAGNWMHKSSFNANVWRRLRDAAGLPKGTRFHDLRHSSATMLLSAGTHPKVMQQRLGHARFGITMDVYAHAVPLLDQGAADVADTILSPKSTPPGVNRAGDGAG